MEQIVIRGRRSLNMGNIAALLERLNMRRPMLVCSARMQADISLRLDLACPVFSGYHANPDLADASAGADMYRIHGCDGLISVGGGSAMTGDMEAVKRSCLPDRPLPHIAIPGTAGTGAEATPIAVVYVNNEKLSLDHPALLPEAIVLDSELLDTLALYHKKACALDALCQGIESYWAVKATEESRAHAKRAILGVLDNLNAYLAGDAEAASAVLEAAYESGCAIRISRTTAAHAMSYQITKRIGPAHGHACMLTLPHLWRHMGNAPVLAEMNAIMHTADGAELLLGLLSALDMLPEALPDDELLDALTASVNVQRLGNHPESLSAEQLWAIYVQALTPVAAQERARLAALWRNYAG